MLISMHRQTWEPTIANMIEQWDSALQGEIEEIWSLDMVNQGDSAYLNKDTLDTVFDWADNGRDILQFVLSYLPDADTGTEASHQPALSTTSKKQRVSFEDSSISHWSSDSLGPSSSSTQSTQQDYKRGVGGWTTEDAGLASSPLPAPSSTDSISQTTQVGILQKQPLPTDMSDLLQLDASSHSSLHSRAARSQPAHKRRWRGRRVVLIGHSVGAAGMIFTASTFPQLFETLILVDPTIFPADTVRWPATSTLVNGAIIRRTQWKSR